MKHLAAALRMDFLLQWRYGFYYAAAFITLVWIALLKLVPNPWMEYALLLIIFSDLAIVGFYFVAGQIIFEKTERTIHALVVTPLRFSEYLISKIITLTVMALAISYAVIIISYGFDFKIIYFTLGVFFTSILTLMTGVIAVAPFRSVSSFILPSQFYLTFLGLPLVDFLGIFKSQLFYLFPTQGSLILLSGAFNQLELWEILYALVYQTVWVVLLFLKAESAFARHVINGKGGW